MNPNDVALLHRIGTHPHSDYTPIERIESLPKETILSFDGVYESVYQHRDVLKGRKVMLFVVGDTVGKSSTILNPDLPDEKFCTWDQVIELVDTYKCLLGWHTRTHRDLTQLPREEWQREVDPPFPMATFAYPYGNFNAEIRSYVEQLYADAWTVNQGDGMPFARIRRYV